MLLEKDAVGSSSQSIDLIRVSPFEERLGTVTVAAVALPHCCRCDRVLIAPSLMAHDELATRPQDGFAMRLFH